MLSSVYLFFSFNASEIMFILFVALILFGGDKFPEIARGLGKGIREFKDMSDGVKREIHEQINSYDAEPRREVETNVVAPAEAVHEPVHEPVIGEQPLTAHQAVLEDIAAHTPPVEPVSAYPATTEPEKTANVVTPDAPKKIDLSKPPNTISHQSY
jgi:sec-independent protein translocase protein TatA